MDVLGAVPEPGQIARVRTRTYLVEGVSRDSQGNIVRMFCLDDDAQGQELEVLWELDKQIVDGLTKMYNRFHDPEETSPDILLLRELHAAMVRAVLDAYRWTDIPTDCEFILDCADDEEDENEGKGRKRKKPWRYRWPDLIRDEVLAKLLALNAERAEEERLAGAATKGNQYSIGGKLGRKSVVREIGPEFEFGGNAP